MDSIRQQIITTFHARMEEIRRLNGYTTDVGAHVFPWATEEVTMEDTPSLTYRDRAAAGEQTTIEDNEGQQEFALSVEIEVADNRPGTDRTAAATCRAMIADVYAAIGVDDTWGGLALYTTLGDDEMELQRGEHVLCRATITVVITYRTKMWDPYNQ